MNKSGNTRRKMPSRKMINLLVVLVAVAGTAVGAAMAGYLRVVIAVAVAYVIWRIGFGMLRGLAQPLPPPPEAGQLRKVKLHYHCSICGAEVRMTVAPEEDPEPPRHCQDEMDLVAPIE